jgi:hypothetical protein
LFETTQTLLQDENSRHIQADLDQDAIKRAKSTAESMQEVTELDIDDGDDIAHVSSSLPRAQGQLKKRLFTQPYRPYITY